MYPADAKFGENCGKSPMITQNLSFDLLIYQSLQAMNYSFYLKKTTT